MKACFLILNFLFIVPMSYGAEKPRVVIVKAQQLIEDGEFKRAQNYLIDALQDHPENSVILALYGVALYENKEIEEAELQFMDALRIDPLNSLAKDYVEVIRATSSASVSEQTQLIEEVAWDKLGDLIVTACAFMLGSVLSSYVRRISSWRFSVKSRRLFLKGDYDDFADLLEIQLTTNELKPLRQSLKFMLHHKTLEEVTTILNTHVNSEDNLKTFERMIRLNYEA